VVSLANFCSECGHSLAKSSSSSKVTPVKTVPKRKRAPSAYSLKYGRAFKSVQKQHKKKNGQWKKDGFKRAQKAAHKKAKRMR